MTVLEHQLQAGFTISVRYPVSHVLYVAANFLGGNSLVDSLVRLVDTIVGDIEHFHEFFVSQDVKKHDKVLDRLDLHLDAFLDTSIFKVS